MNVIHIWGSLPNTMTDIFMNTESIKKFFIYQNMAGFTLKSVYVINVLIKLMRNLKIYYLSLASRCNFNGG